MPGDALLRLALFAKLLDHKNKRIFVADTERPLSLSFNIGNDQKLF